MNHKQFRELVSTMPPLKHSVSEDAHFDIENSEVVKWLVAQPDVMQYIFSRAVSTNCIEYDKATGMWAGRWCDAEFDETGGRLPVDRELFMAALVQTGATKDSPASIAGVQRHMEARGQKVSSETTRVALMGLVKQQRAGLRCDVRPYQFWPLPPATEVMD